MTRLSDGVVRRLRGVGHPPEFLDDRYSVVRDIGRGGMGTVYLAIDSVLEREVAIKVPHVAADEELERRLQLEVRALARLEHPGIVPIHDCGRLADGRLFYVMKRIQGRTLREHLPDLPDEGARLSVFERLCDPVAFAHARGVVHRDLKPENVMLGAFGEVMVMDWGIAKMVDAAHDAGASVTATRGGETGSGAVLGTHGFMSPEQAGLRQEAVDARSDVYSLGAILFMLLTGDRPPAPGEAAVTLASRRSIAAPLRSICARAMAADAAARYPSVKALADDVAAYRSHRAVQAHRETVVERAARFGRAYRTPILLILAYIVMRAVVAFVTGR